MKVDQESERAWARVDRMAHALGWHKEWTPQDPPWVDYICQKMAWCHMQDQLRKRDKELYNEC